MKCRSGFVSNSSSASFVLLGFEVPASEKDANIAKLREFFKLPPAGEDSDGLWDDDLCSAMDRANLRYATHTERGAPDEDTHLLGYVLNEAHSDDGCWRRGETSFTMDRLTELASSLGSAMNFRKSERPIKLYTGTRMA